MRRPRLALLSVWIVIIALAVPLPALADGIIIPEPPICHPGPCPEPIRMSQLAIEYHRVNVEIVDQVAITHVDQVFRNDNDWVVEGTYVFPIPLDATVTEFILWMDGEPVEGEVLTKQEAREIYEDIVRTLRDPALLEYIDRGAVQASVFPIQPGERRRIELEYSQVLTADAGLIHYAYPLNTEKFSTQPLEEVTISMQVDSNAPVRAIYSPSHSVDINRKDNYHFTVGYEKTNVLPDTDFELYYTVATDDIGLNLMTYRDPASGDDDGYFLLLAAPSVEVDVDEVIAKDMFLVLDQSGSMEGEKFHQAQEALRYVLDHLNPDDRFNIIAFSTGTRAYAGRLRSADEADEAKDWVDRLAAQGSTDINRALLETLAQADRERPTIVIFLTDGLPTTGEQDREDIIANIREASGENIRLFTFGVGYDVDTFLLDTLAQENRGIASYVTPGQAIDEAISNFYEKVSTPVLADLELDFGDIRVYDLHPEPLPDLFAGGQLVLVGRYRSPGDTTIQLSGTLNGREQTFVYPEQYFRSRSGPDFLPRLWATRKIGTLLAQVRLQGPDTELIEQIVRLSIRYGIVTEYTSYLVTEPEMLGQEAQATIVADAFEGMMAEPPMAFGQAAVERSAVEAEIHQADVAVAPSGNAADVVRVVGSRTFRLIDGVWIDTAFDPDTMETTRVSFLSDDYFALANARPDLAAAFALGENVIAIADGVAYQIVGSEASTDPVTIPDPITNDDPSEVGNTSSRGISLPCPGFAMVLGLAALPLSRRLRGLRP
ncbi:MAG TPA: VWA domain-containing protein [Anaerolineae bacterium]|nr:VWA domain-containing protein [Anaerolineae bacterium]